MHLVKGSLEKDVITAGMQVAYAGLIDNSRLMSIASYTPVMQRTENGRLQDRIRPNFTRRKELFPE